MPLKTKEIESGLLRKGFEKKNKDHKTLRYVTIDGVRTSVITHYSHGSSGKEVYDGEISAMARQCKISNRKFKQLVDCKLTREAYEELLHEYKIL